jgi:hypothetical protein
MQEFSATLELKQEPVSGGIEEGENTGRGMGILALI